MTVDELIQDLEYFKSKYGNLEVKVSVYRSAHIEAEEVSVYYEDIQPSYVMITPQRKHHEPRFHLYPQALIQANLHSSYACSSCTAGA